MDYSLLLGVHYRAPQHLRSHVSFRRRGVIKDVLTVLSEEGKDSFFLHNFYPDLSFFIFSSVSFLLVFMLFVFGLGLPPDFQEFKDI